MAKKQNNNMGMIIIAAIILVAAFYYFTQVTMNEAPIESDDWVAAFKGDVCVGARLWNTSGFCSNPI